MNWRHHLAAWWLDGRLRWLAIVVVAVIVSLLIVSDAWGKSPVAGAGWCAEKKTNGPGCDLGVGVSLYSWKRAHLVGVLGAKTIGGGIAWLVTAPDHDGPAIAVALGVVAKYDSDGIDSELYPALGATLSFGAKVSK